MADALKPVWTSIVCSKLARRLRSGPRFETCQAWALLGFLAWRAWLTYNGGQRARQPDLAGEGEHRQRQSASAYTLCRGGHYERWAQVCRLRYAYYGPASPLGDLLSPAIQGSGHSAGRSGRPSPPWHDCH